MSKRKLPEFMAVRAMQAFKWELAEEAVAHFDAGIRAADEQPGAIEIFGAIGADPMEGTDNSAKRVAADLRAAKGGPVQVYVNSPGGSFVDGVGIYNALREHPGEVVVNVMGLAGSAASVIAMAGDRIRIPKAGFIMVHNASGLTLGNQWDHADALEMLQEIDASMAEVYADRAGVKPAQAAAWMAKSNGAGTMFRGQAAIDAGLADELMARDERVVEPKGEPDKVAAQIEFLLMKAGCTRSEARARMREFRRGMPDAAANDATPDAGEDAAKIRAAFKVLAAR